jgi:hypothetical protein
MSQRRAFSPGATTARASFVGSKVRSGGQSRRRVLLPAVQLCTPDGRQANILHKVGIKSSSPNDVYSALTKLEGLFPPVDDHHTRGKQGRRRAPVPLRCRRFRHEGARASTRKVVDGPQEWIGTKIASILSRKATGPSSSLSTKSGRSRSSSCIIAGPNRGVSPELEVASRNREACSLAQRDQARQL